MKPDRSSLRLLGSVRATAKMHEFRVAEEDFVEIPRDPKLLFSLAIGILGDAAANIAEGFVNSSKIELPPTWEADDYEVNEKVRFSAIFFDAYVDAMLDEEIATEFSLLCASSYYLSENVGSALVVARRSASPELELGHGLARTAHAILMNDFEPIEGSFAYSKLANELLHALKGYFSVETSEKDVANLCGIIRESAYQNGSARELYYADIVAALCSRKLQSSARNILPPSSGLSVESWIPAMSKPHFPMELWPAQKKICEAGLLLGNSAVIQMPTSAGKTRATELVIRSSILSGRANLAVIVAPFKSLCHDIRSDLVNAFAGEDISMDEVSDSFQLDIDLAVVFSKPSVLVVTPEKLLYMLRRAPEMAERIGLVVYDEGHQFEGLKRGPTYELLLSSLRMSLQPVAQVVLISAVIGNAAQIAGWLVSDETAVVDGKGLLPTAKSIAFASWVTERGQLQYVSPIDPDEVEFFVPRILDVLQLSKKSNRERERVFPDRNHPSQYKENIEVALYLGLHLVPNGSVAVFCGQKASVTKACARMVDLFERELPLHTPQMVSNAQEIEALSFLSEAHLGSENSTTKAARIGVLSHQGNTPHGLRLSIEHAMKEGLALFPINA